MKKIVLLAAVTALFVGMLAGPASAGSNAVAGVLTGTADIGDGACGAGSAGLLIPPFGTGSRTYHFSGTGAGVLGTSPIVGTLDICGSIRSFAGVGAACGISQGHDGSGTVAGIAVSNVSWVTSAGGTLPITADTTSGKVAGVVQAQGGANCVATSGDGANSFTVVGAFAGDA